MMGDPEGPEEGVTASCACTLPGTAMEKMVTSLARDQAHLCSGVGVGGEWQSLFPSVLCGASCHTVPLPDLSRL